MKDFIEAFKLFKKAISSHRQKLYRFIYKEGLIEDEFEELSQEELFIIFQYRLMTILEECLEEVENHGSQRS